MILTTYVSDETMKQSSGLWYISAEKNMELEPEA